MQITPADQNEQLLILEALLEAAQNLDEEANLLERRGLTERAARTRLDTATLRAWYNEVDDLELPEST